MSKFNLKISKTFFFILIILFIIFLSESLYFLNNKQFFKSFYYFKKANLAAKNLNTQQALEYLNKAAIEKIKTVKAEHPNQDILTPVKTFTLSNNSKIEKDYLNVIKNINSFNLSISHPTEAAPLFYNLGLLAYKHQEFKLPQELWQTAISLGSEWSYFHLELANFYLNQNGLSKTKSQLQYCLQFTFPKSDCQEYLEKNLQTHSPKEVGFWKDKINTKI